MIAFLNSCDGKTVHWRSEIFEDISERLKSQAFIACIEALLKKFPEGNSLQMDVDYAKAVLEE